MFASFKGGIGQDRGTAILVSDFPEGMYVPWSEGYVTLKGHECLDGTFYMDESGQAWTVFCHEWTEMYYGKIKAMKLSEDLKYTLDEEPIVIVDWKEINFRGFIKCLTRVLEKKDILRMRHIYGNFRPAYCL